MLTRGKPLERKSRLKSSRGPIDKAARQRRRKGGKLAAGRDSGTRASLHAEREYVRTRAQDRCEIGVVHLGTDFAHVVARSQGGEDTRFNALWLCRVHHRAMERPYAQGRLLVNRVTVKGIRGFAWEIVKAAGKVSYRLGECESLGAGFIAAEKQA